MQVDTIDKSRELRAYRFGMLMFLVTQAVPFTVIYAVEYLFDEFYISPKANQWLGTVEVLLVLASWWLGRQGLAAIRQNRLLDLVTKFRQALLLGTASLVVLGYQWGTRFVPPSTRYGEVYYTLTGVTGFYTLVSLFVLLAISIRAAKVKLSSDNYWDAEATMYLWTFGLLTNVISYVLLYWI